MALRPAAASKIKTKTKVGNKGEKKGGTAGWAASGFKAADENFKKSSSKFLPTIILKDEQSAKCRIYNISGANPLVYRTHSLRIGGFWKSFTCPGGSCSLCAVGNYASPAAAFGVKDLRKVKYKGKDGKVRIFHNESRLLVLRRNSLPLFKKLATSGKLFSRVVEVTRYGDKRDTMYHPDVLGRFTAEQEALEFELDIHALLAPPDKAQLRQLASTFANPKGATADEEVEDEDDEEYMSDEDSAADDDDDDDEDDDEDAACCENCGDEDCDGSCVAEDE